MDEFLSEKEQLEEIRQWWSDYGWYVLGGAAIALLGLFGYQRYQDGVAASAESAAALYADLEAAVADDDFREADRVLAELRTEYDGSPYADNGRLLLSSMVLVSNTDRAIEELRGVMETSDTQETAMIARLRLARILAWQEQYDAALELLAANDSGPFAARTAEIRGDVLLASGDRDAARSAYTNALVAPGSESVDRNFLQMKIGSLMEAAPAAAVGGPEVIDLEAAAAESATAAGTASDEADDAAGGIEP